MSSAKPSGRQNLHLINEKSEILKNLSKAMEVSCKETVQTGLLVSKMPTCFLNARDWSPEKVYFSNIHLPLYKPDQKGEFIRRKTRTIYPVPSLKISPIKPLDSKINALSLFFFFKLRIHLIQDFDFLLYTKMIISIIAQTNFVDPRFTPPLVKYFYSLLLLNYI